jgi:hypothetical protein
MKTSLQKLNRKNSDMDKFRAKILYCILVQEVVVSGLPDPQLVAYH